jgi:hypothetical protein
MVALDGDLHATLAEFQYLLNESRAFPGIQLVKLATEGGGTDPLDSAELAKVDLARHRLQNQAPGWIENCG